MGPGENNASLEAQPAKTCDCKEPLVHDGTCARRGPTRRLGELLSLWWREVDLAAGWLKVPELDREPDLPVQRPKRVLANTVKRANAESAAPPDADVLRGLRGESRERPPCRHLRRGERIDAVAIGHGYACSPRLGSG
jgi:hypothetical protein